MPLSLACLPVYAACSLSLACLPACRLAEVLKADKDKKIKAVCVVHNETTTGVTSDIPEVRRCCISRYVPPLI